MSKRASKPVEPPKFKRRRSGTATWHMSDEAVDLSVADVYRMTDSSALEFLIAARWGSRKTIRCPHCGTTTGHYWRPQDKRWKCRGCRYTFSVTSDTVFANRKLSHQDLIAGALMWMNSAGGQPALELKRHWRTTYNTAYLLQQKFREALVRGYNVGLLSGDLEVDGAHMSGRNAEGKRGVPKGTPKPKDSSGWTKTNSQRSAERRERKRGRARVARGPVHPKHKVRLPEARRIVLTMRKRSGTRGLGAVESRVAVGLTESDELVQSALTDYIACAESYLNSDDGQAYSRVADKFLDHHFVVHSKMLVGPNGENNNLAEELNARMDRSEKGTYLCLEPKYLLDYALEASFRGDTRRMSNGAQVKLLLNISMNVGRSQFWRGFTHGRHRTLELLHPQPQVARASGPPKGRSPFAGAIGRLPR